MGDRIKKVGLFQKIKGTMLGGTKNKDYTIWGSKRGSPTYFNYRVGFF